VGVVAVPRPRPEAVGGRPVKVVGQALEAPLGRVVLADVTHPLWSTASITATVGVGRPCGIAASRKLGRRRSASRNSTPLARTAGRSAPTGPTRPGPLQPAWRREVPTQTSIFPSASCPAGCFGRSGQHRAGGAGASWPAPLMADPGDGGWWPRLGARDWCGPMGCTRPSKRQHGRRPGRAILPAVASQTCRCPRGGRSSALTGR
jgi:hypothetical protein